MPTFQSLLDEFRRRLDREILAWTSERKAFTSAAAPKALILAERVEALLGAGGKRLRPALVYFGYRACTGSSTTAEGEDGTSGTGLLQLAMATELLHTYLLIHDDIMDHAETRRGLPSVHAFFRDRHQEYRGETAGGSSKSDPAARDHGTAMAILAGDVAQTWAMELFSEALLATPEEERRRGLHETFFQMCREVIDGQFLEMQLGEQSTGGAAESPPERETLLQVLALKSGLYSVQRPLELGAILAGADGPTRLGLRRYGSALGEAFQLQDDLLGVFGETQEVGKPVGGDLEEGKYTLLIHEALAGASAKDRRRLEGWLGRAGLTEDEVAEARELLRRSGGLSAVEAAIEVRETTAREALGTLDLTSEGQIFLAGLVEYLGQRRG